MSSFTDVITNSLLLSKIFDFLPIDDVMEMRMMNRAVYICSQGYMHRRKKINFGEFKRKGKLGYRKLVAELASLARNINELYFENCGLWITDRILVRFLSRNTSMKKLSLKNCDSVLLTDDSMRAIASNCKNLEYLCLDGCNWFTTEAFVHIAHCNSLKWLSIERCETIDEEGLEVVLKEVKRLEVFKLRYCRQLSSFVLRLLGEHCPCLKVLDFSRCNKVDVSAAQCLAKGCKRLKELDFTYTKISRQAMVLLGNVYSHSLVWVSLAATSVNSEVLATFSKITGLEHIDVSFCPRVEDISLTFLSQCTKLTSINLASTIHDCNGAVEAVGRECLQLEELVLEECSWLKPGSLMQLAKNGKNLRKLNIKGCRLIDDDTLCELFQGHSKLKSVNIAGCNRLIGQSIKDLGLWCKELVWLDISNCYSLKDESIAWLVENCKVIKSLKMDGCYWLSTETLNRIGRHLLQLQELILCGCKNVTCEAVKGVLNNPKLDYIDVTNTLLSMDDILELRKICSGNVFVEN